MAIIRKWAQSYAIAHKCVPSREDIESMAVSHGIAPIVVYAVALAALTEIEEN